VVLGSPCLISRAAGKDQADPTVFGGPKKKVYLTLFGGPRRWRRQQGHERMEAALMISAASLYYPGEA